MYLQPAPLGGPDHLDGGIHLRIGCGPFRLPSDDKGVEEDQKCLGAGPENDADGTAFSEHSRVPKPK